MPRARSARASSPTLLSRIRRAPAPPHRGRTTWWSASSPAGQSASGLPRASSATAVNTLPIRGHGARPGGSPSASSCGGVGATLLDAYEHQPCTVPPASSSTLQACDRDREPAPPRVGDAFNVEPRLLGCLARPAGGATPRPRSRAHPRAYEPVRPLRERRRALARPCRTRVPVQPRRSSTRRPVASVWLERHQARAARHGLPPRGRRTVRQPPHPARGRLGRASPGLERSAPRP